MEIIFVLLKNNLLEKNVFSKEKIKVKIKININDWEWE